MQVPLPLFTNMITLFSNAVQLQMFLTSKECENELRVGWNFEGGVRGLFKVLFQNLYGEKNESHEQPHSGSPTIQWKPGPGTSRIKLEGFILQ
jgi:hypothetical protein